MPFRLQRLGDVRELDAVPRDDALFRRVDGAEADVRVTLEQRRHGFGAGPHGDHAAARGDRLHQAGACGDELRRVGQREESGQRCGDDLTDAVAEQDAGLHAPRHPEPRRGVLEGEQRRLRVERLLERGVAAVRVAEHQLADRAAEMHREELIAEIELAAEHRVLRVERATHADVLRPLTGEQEGDVAAPEFTPAGALGVGVRQLLVEQPLEICARADDGGHPYVQMRAADVGGVADVREREIRIGVDEAAIALELQPERGLILRGEREDRLVVRGAGSRRGLHGRRLLEYHGRNGAGEAE